MRSRSLWPTLTKSLGRSRDNWRKHHLAVIDFGNLPLLILSHCRASILWYSYCSQPILTYNWRQNTFQMTKSLIWLKQCQSCQCQFHILKMATSPVQCQCAYTHPRFMTMPQTNISGRIIWGMVTLERRRRRRKMATLLQAITSLWRYARF